ncbi:transglycosylase domain-containing protein [Streptomyces sp. NPDC088261]|uniref:transglycosylase domain-containing protein n=1 Tax=Streptomyces sp. NPDC088261 TaxID=3365851 RepID=UPI00381433ED
MTSEPEDAKGRRGGARRRPAAGRRAGRGAGRGAGRAATAGAWQLLWRIGERAARLRRPDYPRTGRSGVRRWLPSWRQSLSLFGLALAGLSGFVAYAYAETRIPEKLNSFATQQDNVYYWADGTELARSGWVQRQEMPLSKVPDHVRGAVLAAENANFYSDPGVSLSGMARAVGRMITGGETQGGSTITQQYVKNAYLTHDQTASRKFDELLLAVKVDNRLSKDQILEGYLNTSWFGRGTYGIQRAAQAYYGKEVSELDPSEAAFLASLLKGASLYDPALGAKSRARALDRWSWILDRMVTTGVLSAEQRAAYTHFPEPKAPPRTSTESGQPGYLVGLAKTYLQKAGKISDAAFDLGGYQIYTTFDRRRTTALASAVGEVRKGFDPKKPKDRYARTGAASVAPDGRILAVYGGPDFLTQGFNEANAVTVRAGSAFTPFVYAAALRDGIRRERGAPRTPVSPDSVYDADNDLPVLTPEGPYWDRNGKVVKGKNDGGLSWGRLSLHDAMARSANTPFLQLGMDVGLDRVARAAQDAGLLGAGLGPRVPAFSLGNSTPSAIRMASAYGTFAAGGVHAEPYSVVRVTRNGEPVKLASPRKDRVFGAEVSGQVTDALRAAYQRTAAASGEEPVPDTAGKVGTTEDRTAGWFTGYTAREATAVVVYRMDLRNVTPLPVTGLGGAEDADLTYPGLIWSDYLKSVAGRGE